MCACSRAKSDSSGYLWGSDKIVGTHSYRGYGSRGCTLFGRGPLGDDILIGLSLTGPLSRIIIHIQRRVNMCYCDGLIIDCFRREHELVGFV